MVGSCTFLLAAVICYLAVFVVFMTKDPGFAGSTPMISVNLMSLSKMPVSIGFLTISSWKNTVGSALRNGRSASKSTNRHANLLMRQCLFLSIGALLFFPSPFSSLLAQDISLESRIQSANDALAELDGQAQSCLQLFDQGETDAAVNRCGIFMQSLDGSLLADYLENCAVLKTWREEFVTGNKPNDEDAETNLQLLSGIELACGENALQKRTEYVVGAFTLLQGEQSQNHSAALVNRRVTEFEQEQAINSERRRLQNSVFEQQQRRRAATNQQWNNLENELLRQQINRPPFPGN